MESDKTNQLDETKNSTPKHCLYGPSSLERRMLCPASAMVEEVLPNFDTPDARKGTQMHLLMETMCCEDYNPSQELAERVYGERKSELKDLEIGDITDCANMLSDAFKTAEALLEGDEEMDYWNERRLSYSLYGEELYFGTCDMLFTRGKEALLCDWKTGHNEVTHPRENIQLMAYALAAFKEMPELETVWVQIFSPFLHYSPRKYTRKDDMETMAKTVSGVISLCERQRGSDSPMLVPGEAQCRYCKASHYGRCPAMRARGNELALMDPDVTELSDDRLVSLYRMCKAVEGMKSALEDELKSRLSLAGRIDAYSLKERRGKRKVTDVNAMFSAISDHVSLDAFLANCDVAMSRVEAIYAGDCKEKGTFPTLKAGKEEFSRLTKDYVESGKPTAYISEDKQ